MALGLALESPPAALVLSLADVGAVHYPWLPVRRLLLDRYPSIDRLGSLAAPLPVIARDRDDIVPAVLSRRFYDAVPPNPSGTCWRPVPATTTPNCSTVAR